MTGNNTTPVSQTSRYGIAGAAGIALVSGLLAFTTQHEGEVLKAYADPAHGWNVPTICVGHIDGVKRGDVATHEQCGVFLDEDYRQKVVPALVRLVKVEVTPNQALALADFVFNVGEGNFAKSELLRNMNAGNCAQAAFEFSDAPKIKKGKVVIWDKPSIIDKSSGDILLAKGDSVKKWTTGNDIPLAGLIKRRRAERALFEADCLAWEEK